MLHRDEQGATAVLAKYLHVDFGTARETYRISRAAFTTDGIPSDDELTEYLKEDAKILGLPAGGQMSDEKNSVAVFGGGCFWCTEAVFDELRGVHSVVSGYVGGSTKNPTYEQVCTGSTGHAEAIKIEFDSSQISFRDLMTVFFATHDPTTLNRQGNDVGTQYRSAIFYADPAQKQEAVAFIQELDDSKAFKNSIVTTLEPLTEFYPAEDYHQKFYANNPFQSYCQYTIPPKLGKLRKQFAELLKTHGT